MESKDFWWVNKADLDLSIVARKRAIESHRREISKHLKLIEELEDEIFWIEEKAKSKDIATSTIQSPNLEVRGKMVMSRTNYKTSWSWYEKAEFILNTIKEFSSAATIVTYIVTIEKDMRGDEKKRRAAQAAIINAMKPRIGKGVIVAIKDEKGTLQYGLKIWDNGKNV